jgi:hypothetical protein
MSTGCNCAFIEYEPGQWFYLLEHYHAPKNSWDWREHADCFGPFKSEEEAIEHLYNNHANPGGWSSFSYKPHYDANDPVLARLVKEARGENTARLD